MIISATVLKRFWQKNLAIKHFKTAAISAFKCLELRPFLLEECFKHIRGELRNYRKTKAAAFKYDGDLESLNNFSGETLLKDVREKLPALHSFLSTIERKKDNSLSDKVLAVSAILNMWISRNKFVYRNNVLLISGGCKTKEID